MGGRQSDGSSAALTTMPTGSANWNQTIVVDGVTVNNIAGFPAPQFRMRAQQRELAFARTAAHRIDHRPVHSLQIGERPAFPGRFGDPGRMLENRSEAFDEPGPVDGDGKVGRLDDWICGHRAAVRWKAVGQRVDCGWTKPTPMLPRGASSGFMVQKRG
jgi:hypothetical protein